MDSKVCACPCHLTRAESGESGYACSSLSLSLACSPPRPAICSSVCNGAIIDLRLVEKACGCSTVRGVGSLQVRARLYHLPSCEECLPPWPAACRLLCNEAAMKLRLVEQACGCSTVRDECRLQVRAPPCRRHSCGECLPLQPAACSLVCNESRHEAS